MHRHTRLSAMSSALSTSGLNLNTTDECLPDSSKHSTTSPSFSMLKIFNLGNFSDLLRRCFVLSTVARFASSLTESLHLCQYSLVSITTIISVRIASSLSKLLHTVGISVQHTTECNTSTQANNDSAITGITDDYNIRTTDVSISLFLRTHCPYDVNRIITINKHNSILID